MWAKKKEEGIIEVTCGRETLSLSLLLITQAKKRANGFHLKLLRLPRCATSLTMIISRERVKRVVGGGGGGGH